MRIKPSELRRIKENNKLWSKCIERNFVIDKARERVIKAAKRWNDGWEPEHPPCKHESCLLGRAVMALLKAEKKRKRP